jgi:hypothetical protein
MKRAAQYVGVCVAIILLLAAPLTVLTEGGARQAVWISASLALVVQVVTFTVARLMPPERLMVGWGLGALLRLVLLVVYGVMVAQLSRQTIAPALLSFVAFLFVTTLVEPVFLKR